MNEAVTIRPGNPGDHAFVTDLGRRVAATSISTIRPVPVALVQTSFDRLVGFIFAHRYDLLVACEGTAPRGFLILLRDLPDEVTTTEQGFVAYMAVEPQAQRRGIGTALLRAAEELARADGLPFLSLMVTEDNTAARHVYERLGFRTERRLMSKAVE